MKTRWYKDAVIYQIYPKSFCDSNNDGVGDLNGIISRLDYIKNLGVSAIWLCPIYPSPDADNGYDVSDYRSINPKFGTMEDFKRLLKEMKKRGLRLIMDLVANHTSDKHPWFLESKKSKDNPYRDYYIWKKGFGFNKKGKLLPPNNWTSRFTGTAWTYDETTQEWYLHLYAKQQPDLNWHNPKVRQEIVDICNYWLEMGVDGFRCDVITNVVKDQTFKDGKRNIALVGDEHFIMKQPWHIFMRQLAKKSWNRYDTLIVAEGMGANVEQVKEATHESSKEFDSFITFDHLDVDFWMGFLPTKFKLTKFKKVINKWQQLPKECWPTLYLENHDQLRSTSHYIKNKDYTQMGAKMLCVALHFQRGTPYVYQGQELGMTNCYFKFNEYDDPMAKTIFKKVKSIAPILMPYAKKIMQIKSRDNSRTPMQWTSEKYAGFSNSKPWLKVNENKDNINAQKQIYDENSVYNFYKKVISLRKGNKILMEGAYIDLMPKHKSLFVFERRLGAESYLIICNFTSKNIEFGANLKISFDDSNLILSNYPSASLKVCSTLLQPYETRVYKLKNSKTVF